MIWWADYNDLRYMFIALGYSLDVFDVHAIILWAPIFMVHLTWTFIAFFCTSLKSKFLTWPDFSCKSRR